MSRRELSLPGALAVLALLAAAALPFATHAQVVNSPPSVSISNPEDGASVRGEVNVTGDASDMDGEVEHVEVKIDDGRWREANGTSPWNTTWDTTLWESGNHTITARAWDGSDYSENETINVTVDRAPSVTIQNPGEDDEVEGVVDVRGTADDPENSLDQVRIHIDDGPWQNVTGTSQWSFSWNTTNVTDGNHSLTVQADDGNLTTTEVVNVTVGNEANEEPIVAIDEPSANATVSGEVEVSGTASDPDGSVEQVLVRVDDGFWQETDGTENWTFTWQTSSWEDGEHTVVVKGDDGEDTSTASVNVTTDNGEGAGDAQTPRVTITDPADGARVNGTVLIEGVASDPDGSVERVEVRLDDGPWQTAEGTDNWTFEWDASNASEGPHTIRARSLSEQRASSVDGLTLHVTPPEEAAGQTGIEIVHPENGTAVEGEIRIAGTVATPDEVDNVEVRVGNGSWQATEGTENWTVSLDTAELKPGSHRLFARAITDEEPYPRTSVLIQVGTGDEALEATQTNGTEDGQAPSLNVNSPQDGETVGSELTFAGSAQDGDDEFVRAEIRVDDQPWQSVRVSTGERFSTTVSVGDLQPGEHTVTMRASDGEHLSEEHTATVVVEDGAMSVPGPGIGLALAALCAAAIAAYRRP